MNFQYIAPVEKSKDILDISFRKARVRGKQKNLKGNWLEIIRKKEALKLDIVKDITVTRLAKILDEFPETLQLPDFYVKLMKLTLEFSEYKKSCGAISWALDKIRNLHSNHVKKIFKEKEGSKVKLITKQFYGRLSSILKQIDPQLKFLESSRKIMRTYPDIKEMYTVCIYGFPNVGKSTLLNKLTGTKAETAAYAFTTKSINSGHIKIKNKEIQFLDVPGTLARKNKMNNIELQAELVLKEVADLIIYCFDISGFCGYSIEFQEQLLQKIIKEKNILIYVCKKDIPETKEKLKGFSYKHYTLKELKEKIFELAPKIEERIIKESEN